MSMRIVGAISLILVSLWGVSGCATWTPAQRASWDNVVLGLQGIAKAAEAARHENDHRQMELDIAALRMHQAMPSPFSLSR